MLGRGISVVPDAHPLRDASEEMAASATAGLGPFLFTVTKSPRVRAGLAQLISRTFMRLASEKRPPTEATLRLLGDVAEGTVKVTAEPGFDDLKALRNAIHDYVERARLRKRGRVGLFALRTPENFDPMMEVVHDSLLGRCHECCVTKALDGVGAVPETP
jgi:hypothetical protein